MAFNIIYKSNDEEEEKKRKKLIEEGANQQLERNRQANEQFNRNYEERNNFFNNVGRVADSFLTGLGTTAANVGTGVLSVINDDPVNLATRSARDNLIGKIENTDLAGYAEKLKAIKNPTEQKIDWLNDIKRQNEAKIQNLQSQTDSEVARNIIGFVPNLSQQAVNIGASLVNPGLGMAVATAGAKGSYLDVAKQRGMNEEESRTFSNIMAVVEGATEMIGINNITKGIKGINALAKTGIKGAKKEIQKEIVDTAIKSYGKSILDNAIQEAITEPIQEAVADITAKKGDWNNVLGRSLESGFSGALTAAITGGVSMGISSAVGYVQKLNNGYKPTQAETIQAVNQIYNEATENQKQVLNYAIKDGVEIATQQSALPIEENGLKSNVETNNTILESDKNNNIDIKDKNIVKNRQYLNKKFEELTGDTILRAQAKLAGIEVRNNQRKNGNLEGNLETIPYSDEAMNLLKTYENNKKSSNYLYHSTSINNLQNIIENGLTLGNKQNQEGVSSKNKIYLASTEELANSFSPQDSVTLRINPQYNIDDLDYDLLGGEGAYTTGKKISADNLQIKKDGKWINLTKYAAQNQVQEQINNKINNQNTEQQITNQDNKVSENELPEQKNSTENNYASKWEVAHNKKGEEYQRKLVREFKDNDGNEFRLYQLTNNHNELAIKEKNQNGQKIIDGSRNDILKEIHKYWKGEGTFSDIRHLENNQNLNNQNTEQQTLLNRTETTQVAPEAKPTTEVTQELPTTPAEEVTEMERPQLPQVKQRQAEPITQPSTQPVLPISETKSEMGQRKTYKTIAENINQPQEVRDIAQSLRETNLYQKKKNSEVLAQAKNKIKNVGADNLLNDITDRVNNNARLSTEDTGTLIELLDYYGKNGDTQRAETTLQNLAMSGTETAQALQIQRALNHQTPQGQAIWIQRSADKLNKSILAKKKATIETINGEQRIIDKNGKDITSKTPLFNFTQEMQQKLLNANSDNMYDVIDEIYTEMGQQVPKSKIEQFDEWRYFSMLGNPKTHIRNMLGNITMEGLRQAKNKLAGAIEDAYYSVTGKEGERTHTLRFADKKTKDFAKQDVKNRDVQTMLGVTEDKYNPQSRLKQSQRTFKSEALEKTIGRLEKANTNLLSKEDVSVLGIAGLEPAYQRSLTEYITANNLDVDTMTSKQLAKAREYAVAEAKEATFHTYNKIASMINTLENKNLATKILVGGTVPFKQTPMNVAIQGFEYSPAGLLKTLTYDTVQLKNGNINANQYINKISKGLTGTGIALLGYALTSAGILKASGSGDDKDDYEKAQGKQTYSIKIGDNTYTLDWLAPAGIPLFIGSELYQISKADAEEKKGGNATQSEIAQSAENIFNAMTTTMNPMTEMTMLSGLTSTLKSYANDPAQTLGNILINTGKSYVTQSVPTALGQVARSTDDKERSTSSTESNVFTKAIDSTKNQIMSKVPGLRQLLPVATDVWGNEAKSKNYIENAILPANRKEIKEEPLDKELTRLYDATGESSVIPDTYIDKTLTIAKEKYRLSNEEYADLKKQYGQTSYKILSNLTSSSDYKNMTDEQKVKAVTEAYKYAKASLKVTYADWNNLDADANSTYKKVQNVIDKGGDAKDYFTYVGLTDGLKTETEKNRALRDSDLGSKSAIYESTTGSDDQIYPIMKKAKTNINAYLDYKLADIQGIKNEEGKTISGSKKQAFNDYLNSSKMNYNQRLLLKGVNYKLTNYEKNLLLDYLDTLKLSDNEYNDVLLKLK